MTPWGEDWKQAKSIFTGQVSFKVFKKKRKAKWCTKPGHDEAPQKDCTQCMWDMEDEENEICSGSQ